MKTLRRKNPMIQKSKSEKIVFGIMFCVFTLWAITLMYPFVWLIINSLKHNFFYLDDLNKFLALPKSGYWEFDNYAQAFSAIDYQETTLLGMIFNSLWTAFISLGVNLFFSACTGYVLSKYKFKGRDFIYATAIVAMTLPVFGTGGATYTFYYVSGMYDTPFYIIFSQLGAFSMRFMMMYGFFKGISWEYAEAVFLDGGSHFTVFFKIMLPIAAPMVSTLAIMGFIAQWNTYESYLIYLPSYPTLAVGVFKISEYFDGDKPVYYAAMVLSIIPVIVVFSCFIDKIMKNYTVGGLKG